MVNKYNKLGWLLSQAYSKKPKHDIQRMQNIEWTRVKSSAEAYDDLVARLQTKIERNGERKRAM